MDDADRAREATEAEDARKRESMIAEIRASFDAQGREDCVTCGEEIEPARREAMPSAVRCVGCQTLFERGGR